ncbi:MAG: terpene cyclase/mutase family protein [Akkermansiaceae bacterium]|nr:terpene cyclase/mutase family protein [Akkermansiaceae bacterium]
MSLHAQLSPEAEAALLKQQRNTTITSIIISILSCILLLLILLFWWLKPIAPFKEDFVTYKGDLPEPPSREKPTFNRPVQHKPSRPSAHLNKVIISNIRSNIAIPVIDIDTPTPSTDLGSGDDFGQGMDEGTGIGSPGFRPLPYTIRKRCSEANRIDLITQNGGNAQCETAVVNTLRWLQKTQNPDGSWTSDRKVSMTAFALLTFLGHCETPDSEEFGDAVTKAISYLVNVGMKNNGKLADDIKDKHWPYEHAIATYALAEATTFCISLDIPFPRLMETTKAAGDWILEHQHTSGAWDYAYDMSGKRGGDTSIALWHIQALKACKHTGLWENSTFRDCIKKSLSYLKGKQGPDGGVGYASPSPSGEAGFTMTGGAMLAYQMWGKSHDSVVRKGARYIKKNARLDYHTADADLYRHYYHVQAMMHRGGDDWRAYNTLFRDQLLANQNADGSYKNVGGGSKVKAVAPTYQGVSVTATHYRTCLATLMLETYYRFLPATGKNAIH